VAGADFLSINEKREELGYGPVEGGDVVLIDATKVPLGFEPGGDMAPNEGGGA
jgi:hypothetical protein